MNTFNRYGTGARAAAAPGFSQVRRRLLLLGMTLGGFAVGRRILHLPPRPPGQPSSGGKLSHHEAAFYSALARDD